MKASLHASHAVLLASSSFAQSEPEGKLSDSASTAVIAKRKLIRQEIKETGAPDWAGDYTAGNGTSAIISLVIAPTSGFVFAWECDLGLLDQNYGPVVLKGGRIRLSFTFENVRKPLQGIAPEFIPLHWSARRYLIPADDVVGFCNEINEGSEPRSQEYGFYLLRKGDEKLKIDGPPRLPDEYKLYLLPKPIEAKIIAVGPSTTQTGLGDLKYRKTPITIDAGTSRGLLIGMKVFVAKPDCPKGGARITKIEADRAEATLVQGEEEEQTLTVGLPVSTFPGWRERKTE